MNTNFDIALTTSSSTSDITAKRKLDKIANKRVLNLSNEILIDFSIHINSTFNSTTPLTDAIPRKILELINIKSTNKKEELEKLRSGIVQLTAKIVHDSTKSILFDPKVVVKEFEEIDEFHDGSTDSIFNTLFTQEENFNINLSNTYHLYLKDLFNKIKTFEYSSDKSEKWVWDFHHEMVSGLYSPFKPIPNIRLSRCIKSEWSKALNSLQKPHAERIRCIFSLDDKDELPKSIEKKVKLTEFKKIQ